MFGSLFFNLFYFILICNSLLKRSYPFWQGSRSEALEQLTKRYSCLLMQTPVVLKHVLLKWYHIQPHPHPLSLKSILYIAVKGAKSFCRSSMINWLIYLLCAPWCSLSVTLSEKKDVEYANSDIGIALKSTRSFYIFCV